MSSLPRTKLTDSQIESALSKLPGWTLASGKLHREYKFPDFAHAFGFMAVVATQAEKMDHHPDWTNIYNRVSVNLSTHDVGGITELDLKLAGIMEKVAQKLQ